MEAWDVRVARGWLDGQPPSDVAEVLTIHGGQDKLGALCLHAKTAQGDLKGSSDIPFYEQSKGLDTAGSVFDVVTAFLGHLSRVDVDVVCLVFVNFKPDVFTLSPRPESVVTDAPSLLDGFGWFCQSVAGSIRGEAMWSLCEWAIVYCCRKGVSIDKGPEKIVGQTSHEPHGAPGSKKVFRFVGGEYNGKEVSVEAVNKHAHIVPVSGDLGTRLFALMPPLNYWQKFLKTNAEPLYPYERVFTESGPEFHAAQPGSLDKALSESKIRVDALAKAALDTLAYSERTLVIDELDALRREQPSRWPAEKVRSLDTSTRKYLLTVPPRLCAVFTLTDKNEILVVDVLHADAIERFLTSQGIGSAGG